MIKITEFPGRCYEAQISFRLISSIQGCHCVNNLPETRGRKCELCGGLFVPVETNYFENILKEVMQFFGTNIFREIFFLKKRYVF